MHGGLKKDELKNENVNALKIGMSNLKRHINNIKKFGLPVIVAINQFVLDTAKEISTIKEECVALGVEAIECSHWAEGGDGTIEISKKIVDLTKNEKNSFQLLYKDEMPLIDKIRCIVKEIYGADDIVADNKIRQQLKQYEDAGYGKFPICIAKTQYSFSTDPSLKGSPSNHSVPIREVRLSSGAEFLVIVCGAIMTMPGLPSVPAANSIHLNNQGEIEGLF